MKHNPGKSYSIAEWCELRNLSRVTAWRLVRDGKLKTYKVGSRRFVTEAADRAFIEERQGEAAA